MFLGVIKNNVCMLLCWHSSLEKTMAALSVCVEFCWSASWRTQNFNCAIPVTFSFMYPLSNILQCAVLSHVAALQWSGNLGHQYNIISYGVGRPCWGFRAVLHTDNVTTGLLGLCAAEKMSHSGLETAGEVNYLENQWVKKWWWIYHTWRDRWVWRKEEKCQVRLKNVEEENRKSTSVLPGNYL